MPLSEQDRAILRDLGERVAAIAALPAQQETVRQWIALNRLRPERPMVMIDQVCWHEMATGDELTPRGQDPFWRVLEVRLRRLLYQWEHMRVDMVVQPWIDIPRAIGSTGYGMRIDEDRAVLDPANTVVGHRYHDTIKTDDDIQRIRTPRVTVDRETDARREAEARTVFEGILNVRMQGAQPSFAPWDKLAMWRGPEALLYDLADRPDFIHRIMQRLTQAMLDELDQLEEQGALGYGHSTIHCSGAHTDELPAPGFDPDHPRPADIWTSGMAQIFSTVSPATHQEFELEYANRWYQRFGLVYYGCCEPLDTKMDVVRCIPHLRKISMSPWVDAERGSAQIGAEFVFSRKPSPALLAVDDWCVGPVRRDLQAVKDCCAAHQCPLEFILKDISTVRYQPQRLWAWADAAMEVAGG